LRRHLSRLFLRTTEGDQNSSKFRGIHERIIKLNSIKLNSDGNPPALSSVTAGNCAGCNKKVTVAERNCLDWVTVTVHYYN
jgi:hypothetical protein